MVIPDDDGEPEESTGRAVGEEGGEIGIDEVVPMGATEEEGDGEETGTEDGGERDGFMMEAGGGLSPDAACFFGVEFPGGEEKNREHLGVGADAAACMAIDPGETGERAGADEGTAFGAASGGIGAEVVFAERAMRGFEEVGVGFAHDWKCTKWAILFPLCSRLLLSFALFHILIEFRRTNSQ